MSITPITDIFRTDITVTFTYQDGFRRTFQNIPLWWIPYRARSVPNKFRPVRMHIQGDIPLTTQMQYELLRYQHQTMHPVKSEGIWVNGIKLGGKKLCGFL